MTGVTAGIREVMAAPGYVVLMINPRGSFGYGHKFTEEISRDWGGKVYEDLMKGVDAAIAKYPFIDANTHGRRRRFLRRLHGRLARHAHRPLQMPHQPRGRLGRIQRVRAPKNFGSRTGKWADPYWSSPEHVPEMVADEYAGALGKYKTPTLVIAGELDYRVPYTQSLEFFSALQRQGVPSKLLVFPDEGHWILKPQNSEFWYTTFLGWLRTTEILRVGRGRAHARPPSDRVMVDLNGLLVSAEADLRHLAGICVHFRGLGFADSFTQWQGPLRPLCPFAEFPLPSALPPLGKCRLRVSADSFPL